MAGAVTAPTTTGRAAGLAGPSFSLKLRVFYEDTDAAGIVYYANYLKFVERGRTEMMRALGFEHTGIEAATGVLFTVRRLSADYRQPARLDDMLSIDTRVLEIGAATLRLEQLVCRDSAVLAALDVLVACVGRDGRPRRVPPQLRAALAPPASASPSIVQKTP
jgi:acyl-CoA thioester hydrolase